MCHNLANHYAIFADMKPFLRQVADRYYSAGDVSRRCFVFPNRRSMVFFGKHLGERIRDDRDAVPMIAPRMMTVNDFFYIVSGLKEAGRIRLLLDLYDCYKELNPKAESLDEFVFWGDVILGDFNDVDKYLVDPRQLFANVADLKALQDTFEYLSQTQRKAIEGFISHFNDAAGRLTVDMASDNPDVKARFLQIWNILYPLYVNFNQRLRSKGLAYEGMVYRSLAESLKTKSVEDVLSDDFPANVSFVFVGLNALNECEKTLLRKLRDASLAEFCWDWSGDMIRDPQNRSSVFMAENVAEFPQVAEWDEGGTGVPEINIVSVASAVGQAKRIPDILSQVPDFHDCAVVLPDESLLVPVLNSIPDEVKDLNVTMGLPMKGSLVFALISDAASLQLHAMSRNGKRYFYHKQVWDIFSSEIFRTVCDEAAAARMAEVKRASKYYIPQEDLAGSPLTDVLFRPLDIDPKLASAQQIRLFSEYLKDVVTAVAPAMSDVGELALETEFAKECYRSINVLQEISLEVLPVTYVRLLAQMLSAVSVHFKGEPLKGMQIMGPLETRALDFSDVVILSANEGVFPRRNVSSSFIPPELRKGFGLPTYEYQDAVWAYYFYRMISRAERVWMLVDTRTEGLKSGEESRYIKQLEYHFGIPLRRMSVRFTGLKTSPMSQIDKTAADVEKIRATVLSATTLQNYLSCPAKFYYSTIKELKSEEEVVESLDYGMFGTVYHEVMRALYSDPYAMREDFMFDDSLPHGGLPVKPADRVSSEYIRSWLKRTVEIKKKVNALIVRQLNSIEVSGRNLVVADVIVRYVLKTLERDLEQMEAAGTDSFEVLGREMRVAGEFNGQKFKGFIDRLDSFAPDQARIVDYKTGRVLEDDENINEDNAERIAELIFAPDVKDRPKIALQFFLYDMLVQSRPEVQGRKLYNCVYSTSHLFKDRPETVPLCGRFYDAVSMRLKALLQEMYDESVPFRRTDDENVCKYCDFNKICSR